MLSVLGFVSHYNWHNAHCTYTVSSGARCKKMRFDSSKYCQKHMKLTQANDIVEGKCHYILPIKNRRCRMQSIADNFYCAEHIVLFETDSKRVPCPLDPKHSVAQSQLEDHLAKCNSRVRIEDPWIDVNINCSREETKYAAKIDFTPSQVDVERVIALIPEIYSTFAEHINLSENTTQIVENELANASNEKSKKHLCQISSLLGNLSKYVPNCEKSSVFDFGGGRGEMAYYLAQTVPEARIVIVDRAGVMNKFENRLVKEGKSCHVNRLRASIEHLRLRGFPGIDSFSSVSFVSKHFCGSAFDAALRCIKTAYEDGVRVNGFALAPCCAHKCPAVEYCGMSFLSAHGIQDTADFAALRHIASWANCGFHSENSLSCDPEKAEIGRMAKMILLWGRVQYLISNGFEVRMAEFCPSSVTPENVVLIGHHSQKISS